MGSSEPGRGCIVLLAPGPGGDAERALPVFAKRRLVQRAVHCKGLWDLEIERGTRTYRHIGAYEHEHTIAHIAAHEHGYPHCHQYASAYLNARANRNAHSDRNEHSHATYGYAHGYTYPGKRPLPEPRP